MTKRLFGCVAWLSGKPLESRSWRWMERAVLAAVAILLMHASVWGALSVFMPFAPPGFSTVSDGPNTVYFEGDDLAEAKRHLQMTREAQAAVLEFWQDTANGEFPGGGVRIYLCQTPASYERLSLNQAAGSAAGGQAVLLNMTKQLRRNTAAGDLRHELSHVYLARRLGLFRKALTVPLWFDEGTAAGVGELPGQTPADLASYLRASPGLVSPRFLDGYRHWGFRYDGHKRYTHCRLFVSHLIETHGRDAIVDYLDSLSLFKPASTSFEQVFGEELEESHLAWFESMKRRGDLPQDTALVIPPDSVSGRLVALWIVGALLILWIIRQIGRAARLAGLMVSVARNPS